MSVNPTSVRLREDASAILAESSPFREKARFLSEAVVLQRLLVTQALEKVLTRWSPSTLEAYLQAPALCRKVQEDLALLGPCRAQLYTLHLTILLSARKAGDVWLQQQLEEGQHDPR